MNTINSYLDTLRCQRKSRIRFHFDKGATMPFVRRPDNTWVYLSGSGLRNEAGTAARGNDDSLSAFASETTPQVIAASDASIVARVRTHDDAASAKRIQNSTADLRTATHLPRRSSPSGRRALTLLASLAARIRRRLARSTTVIRIPLWMRRARDLRRFAASTTLPSFAGGAASGVLVMWLVSAQPPLPVVRSTTHAATPETTRPPDLPASPPNVQLAAEGIRASSTSPPSSIVSATLRPVGTSGRSTGELNRTVRPSGVASSPSARIRKAAAPPRYRGSLAFRSAPQGAQVFVNGAFVGSTPLVLENLPVGSRAVRMEADGYQRWSASTQVVANQQTRVSATLGRARQ
jgi:hypothetical protein